MNKRVLLISNLYPSSLSPSFGTFVKTNHEQLDSFLDQVDICVIDSKNSGFIHKLKCYLLFFIKQFNVLIFNRNKYDFYYIHYLTISTIPIFICSFFLKIKVDYYINVHGDDLTGLTVKHRILSLTSKFLVKYAKGIVVPSEQFKQIVLKKFGDVVTCDKICVNYSGGIDSNHFQKKPLLEKSIITFGYIGRIEEGKGWEDFIQSIKKLKSTSGIRFLIYGYGDQLDSLNKHLSEIDTDINIEYRGEVNYEEVPKIMSSFDYLVFPTYRESLGLVALESAAVGTPVIRTKIDVLSDVFSDFEHLSFNVGDYECLSKIITRLSSLQFSEYCELSNKHYLLSNKYSNTSSSSILEEFLNRTF